MAHAAAPEDATADKAYRDAREALVSERSPSGDPFYFWLTVYAFGVSTPADAQEALAALPGRLPAFSFEIPIAEAIGRVLALAGRHEEAKPYLITAADNCYYLLDPFEAQHARAMLAELALEAGDRATACQYAAKLLRAWPHTRAASHHRALRAADRAGCSRSPIATTLTR